MSEFSTIEYWFDADGQPVASPADAVTGEIVELDGGYEIRRTYVDLRPDTKVLNVPAEQSVLDPESQDLLKAGTWDVYFYDNGAILPVETLQQLLRAREVDGLSLREQRDSVGRLLETPAWVPAPQQLKDEVYAWLVATRLE